MSHLKDLAQRVHQGNVKRGFWETNEEKIQAVLEKALRQSGNAEPDLVAGSLVHDLRAAGLVGDKDPLAIHALIVSEVAEATEEVRNGSPAIYALAIPPENATAPYRVPTKGEQNVVKVTDMNLIRAMKLKPEGELTELADVVIRVLDLCGRKGWDLDEAIDMKLAYNDTRSYRHGGKLA